MLAALEPGFTTKTRERPPRPGEKEREREKKEERERFYRGLFALFDAVAILWHACSLPVLRSYGAGSCPRRDSIVKPR